MRKLNLLFKSLFLLCALIVGSSAWANDVTATINFGSAAGSTKIEGKTGENSPYTDSGTDSQGNTWTITTVTTNAKSFTQYSAYSQVGASKNPATSITFTTTLPESRTIKAFNAKFGGFSGTAGTITLKVGNTSVGSGNLNAANDVTVSATNTTTSGTVLTVTVTNISKGVKCYYISYTYDDGKSLLTPTISFPQASYTTFYDQPFTAPTPTCNSDGVKTYSSSKTDVVEVNSSTGALTIKKAGNATITLNVAESATYEAGSASYDLIVKGHVEDGIFDFAINQDYGSNAVPGTANDQTTETTWTSGKVTLAVAGRNIWYNGNDLRLYKETAEPAAAAGNITISVPSGYYMTRIDLTGGTNLNLTSGGGAKSGSRWSGKSQSVKFTHNGGGTITLTKIKVYYCTESEFNEKVNVTINTNDGWMTYCYKDANLSFGNLEAYVVSAVGENSVTLTKITKAPAGTALILKGAQGSYELTKEANADVIEANRLGLSSGKTTSNDSYDVYALANKNGVVGFYLVEPGVKVPEGKCYISINKPSSAREFLSIGDDATGIKAVECVTERGVVYDLQGRRVAQPTRGLYIENGKKVIIK